MIEVLALIPILLPLLGAVLTLYLVKYSEKLQETFLVVFSALLFIFNVIYFIALENGMTGPLAYGPILLDAPGMFICLPHVRSSARWSSSTRLSTRTSSTTIRRTLSLYLLLMGMMSGLASTYNVDRHAGFPGSGHGDQRRADSIRQDETRHQGDEHISGDQHRRSHTRGRRRLHTVQRCGDAGLESLVRREW